MSRLQRLLIYLLLILGAITCLIPLLWMLSTGLKPIDQTMSMPPTWFPYRLYVEKDGVRTEIQKGDVDKYPNEKIIREIAPRWENFKNAILAMKVFGPTSRIRCFSACSPSSGRSCRVHSRRTAFPVS